MADSTMAVTTEEFDMSMSGAIFWDIKFLLPWFQKMYKL
jgi:hypothetical protein